MRSEYVRRTVAAIGLMLVCGCANPEVPVLTPSPQIAAIPVDSFPPQPGVEPVTPELPLERRWREPFAVSVSGSTTPHTSGEVVVLDTEPVLDVAAAVPPVGEVAPASSDASPADSLADVPSTYTIRSGDTWYGIARRFGVTVNALAAINPSIDTERIQAGKTIQIPELNPATMRSETIYIVSPGDTLWSIARTHGVSVDVLRRLNSLTDDRIRVGQEIRIPDGE